MAGSHKTGIKARETMYERYGLNVYEGIGRKGGLSLVPEKRPFSLDRKLAARAGRISRPPMPAQGQEAVAVS